MKTYVLFGIGIALMVWGNWPSNVEAYFPYNLPAAMIGGVLFGVYGYKLKKFLKERAK